MATAALSLSPWSVSCVAGGRRAVNDHCGTFHQSLRRAVISTSGGLLSLRLRLRRCFARGRFPPLARPLEKLLAILGISRPLSFANAILGALLVHLGWHRRLSRCRFVRLK